MAIPTWDQFMAPALTALLDGQIRRRRELYSIVADAVNLTDTDRSEALSSGQRRYENRIGWATSYLNRVTAIDRPARGQYAITDVGRKLLTDHPDGITEKHLRALVVAENIPHTWFALGAQEQGAAEANPQSELDPVEQVQQGIDRLNAEVADDLLTRLLAQDPAFFEQAVLDLIMAMGYGGAKGRATRTQLVGDGGIDGIVDQDALGLSRVHVQAKRYAPDNSVGRPEIQAFVGALAGNQANQGVFITTSRFSSGARDYAAAVPTRVVLIDGPRLASLMIRYGVGVQVKRTVQIVEVDEDFFE
ncbi:restriction endonuclease [Mycobacteroides chelonae]|uniref:restriction endonuclease n=1 Tax=Mycobacteroides chelonae TaxID=1774 RepID=UPI0008A8F21B|nr:restriction endonuclease [Mycobacteroides chelonae]OHU23653.1 restriction endonuclease [Mycobacteroides chelonae]